MHFHVLTLFPEMIEQGMNTSIMGRAIERGYISLKATDIRDYAANKHNKVDDTPYGGGAGMVMQAAPVYGAYEAVKEQIGYRPRVIYLTPQGSTFSQPMAEEFAREQDLVFLCGHYEGIDDRDRLRLHRGLCPDRRGTSGNGDDGCDLQTGSGCASQ